jgi:hypothetical protein
MKLENLKYILVKINTEFNISKAILYFKNYDEIHYC